MKKLLLILILILSGVASFLNYMGMFSKVSARKEEKGPYTFAYVEYIGPYSGVAKPMDELNKKMIAAGFHSQNGIGLYYNDPKTTPKEELKSEVGFIIADEDKEKIAGMKEEFKFKTLPVADYIVAEFPMKNFLSYMLGPIKIYPIINSYFQESNLTADGPGIEIYDTSAKKIIFLMAIKNPEIHYGWLTFDSNWLDYKFKYPPNLFFAEPIVESFSCYTSTFANKCPYLDVDGFEDTAAAIKQGNISLTRQNISGEQFCLEKWSDAAAGNIYTNYYYIKPFNGQCSALKLVIHTTNCGVYGEPSDPKFLECEAYNNNVVPGLLKSVTESFDFKK